MSIDEITDFNIDKIIDEARANFKNKDKVLGKMLCRGSNIPRADTENDFVLWKDSPWQLLTGLIGIPYGKIIQVSGKPDSGKSTHAMEFMTRAQAQNNFVILWDSETKFTPSRYDTYFNGRSKDLLIVNSRLILTGSDLIDAYVHSIKSNYPKAKILIVWDSVGGSLSKGEMDKAKRESKQMAEASKENGIACRGFISLMEQYRDPETGKHTIGVLLINQTYSNIGAPGQVESGGQKVYFFSSVIVQLIRMRDLIKDRKKVKVRAGIQTRARVKKNHLFEGEDTVSEMKLDITARGVKVSKNDPIYNLISDDNKSKDDFIDDEELDEEDMEL